VDAYPDPDPGGQNITHENRRKIRNFMVGCAECSLLRAEGFFCGLDVLYGGLGIGKLQFFVSIFNFSLPVNFFNFWSSKPEFG
jgi:hypothetical protein